MVVRSQGYIWSESKATQLHSSHSVFTKMTTMLFGTFASFRTEKHFVPAIQAGLLQAVQSICMSPRADQVRHM
jgi:hypothetical protein